MLKGVLGLQVVLNFKKEELPFVKKFLKQFQQQPTHAFEEMRCSMEGCAVTLFQSGKLVIQGKNVEQVKEKILNAFSLGNELVLGIDEAGRGESTGLFCIAGILGKTSDFREFRDSKKISNVLEKKRLVDEKPFSAVVVSFSPAAIDAFRSNAKNLNQLEAEAIDWMVSFFLNSGFKPDKVIVDGNSLPVQSKNIIFLPKADDLEPVVGAASILAKATREESGNQEKRKTWKSL